jgi:hypothetical protein
MSAHRLLAALSLALAAGLVFTSSPPAAEPVAGPAYRLSEPFTHENVTIFLIRGEDGVKDRKFLTLDEALAQKKVIVHETKNVNNLAIENVSAEEVFVQAGDIVKGGQQDRTIAYDVIVPAKSGKLPLASFCVERGRWNARGGENAMMFSRSGYQLSDNETKMACRAVKGQGEVWAKVAEAQGKLGKNLKAEVTGKESRTSLQLTLEHKKVTEAVETFVKKLQPALDKQTDVIGYAVVINGKVNNADVYLNADLFRKLWPKLIQATAIEAVANRKEGAKIEPVKAEAVTAFLAAAEKGKRTERKGARDNTEVQLEGENNLLFETREKDGKGMALRRSYIAR